MMYEQSDIETEKQTNRQTYRHVDCDTLHAHVGEVINNTWRMYAEMQN